MSIKNKEGWSLEEASFTCNNIATDDRYDLMANENKEQICDCIYGEKNALMFFNAPEMLEIVKAVAHIGIDFGYGKYEIEDKHIEKARKIYESFTDKGINV